MKKMEREKVSWECEGRGPRNNYGWSSSVPGVAICGSPRQLRRLHSHATQEYLQSTQDGGVQVGR